MRVSDVTLSILDVGHGNSAVLLDTEGVVVIDCGPGTALLEFLRQTGLRHVDVVLISHADRDHIEGVVALLESEEYTIGRLRLNSDALKTSQLWNDLVYLLDHAHSARDLDFQPALTTGDTGSYDQGVVAVEVLAPRPALAAIGPGGRDNAERKLTHHSVSAVVRLAKGEEKIALLPGDIDAIGLANLLKDGQDIGASVVVFPHHGGTSGIADLKGFARRLCDAARPDTVIFSIGRGKYGTPQPDPVAAIRRALPGVRITCTQLSEHCADRLPRSDPTHLTDRYAAGREQRKCCGGTFVLRLDAPTPAVLPSREDQAEFIKKHAPTAICMRAPTHCE